MISLTAVETVLKGVWPGVNHAGVSISDPRKGEMLVMITEQLNAEPDMIPDTFRRQGITELSLPRRAVKIQQIPRLGTDKTDYIKARLLVLEHWRQSLLPPGLIETNSPLPSKKFIGVGRGLCRSDFYVRLRQDSPPSYTPELTQTLGQIRQVPDE